MSIRSKWDNCVHPVRALDQWWYRVSPERRLDHNAANICMLLGLMLPSLSIVLRGPTPKSSLNNMPSFLQVWMCSMIFVGCGMILYGAISGMKYFRPRAHVKDCYVWGFAGAPLATAGALVYGYYVLSAVTGNIWSALNGISTPLFGIGISIQAVFYWLEWRRIGRNETIMIREAKRDIANQQRDDQS